MSADELSEAKEQNPAHDQKRKGQNGKDLRFGVRDDLPEQAANGEESTERDHVNARFAPSFGRKLKRAVSRIVGKEPTREPQRRKDKKTGPWQGFDDRKGADTHHPRKLQRPAHQHQSQDGDHHLPKRDQLCDDLGATE